MSNTARTNNRAAEKPVEENQMEERAANTRPKVSSIDEDEEYIPPRANYPLVRVIEQGRYETMAMLRNGEQLMLNIIFPVMALIALRFTGLIDEYANSVGVSRMDAAVPGVLALCVISTALSGQGIATGFDRRYGVLRFLATTPLGRNGLIMGKCIAVLVVVAIQFTLVAVLGYGRRLALHHHDDYGCRRIYGAGSAHCRYGARGGDPRHREYRLGDSCRCRRRRIPAEVLPRLVRRGCGVVALGGSGRCAARQLHSVSVACRPALGIDRMDRGHWVYCLAQVQVVRLVAT